MLGRGELIPFPTYDPPQFPPLKSKLVVREAAVPNPLIRMFWHGPSVLQDEPDPYVADVFFTMVNQPTSRAYSQLVDSGLVTNIYAGYQSARNTGQIALYATAPEGKTKKALTTIKQEIQAMAKPGYFTDEDLEIAKQILADNRVFERENTYNFTIRTVAFWWSVAGGLDYYESLTENYNKVTHSQIQKFVRDYLLEKEYVLGIGAKKEVLENLNVTEEDLKW